VSDPELLGPGTEGPHILGQAPPAITEACVEEPPSDAGVVPDRVGQRGDVGAGLVADLGDGVMKEILVARKAFAEVLTSSAVA